MTEATHQPDIPEQQADPALELIQAHIGPEDSRTREVIVTTTTAALGAGAAYAAVKYGSPLFDPKVVPEVPVIPQIAEGIRQVNDGIRTIAPGVLAGGIGAQVYYKAKSLVTRKDRAIHRTAQNEYRTDVASERASNGRLRRIGRGLALAAFSATLIAAASGIEDEVSNGPNRPIAAVFNLVSDSDDTSMVTQYSEAMFMNDSYVSQAEATRMQTEIAKRGGKSAIVGKSLPQITGGDINMPGLALTLPKPLFEQVAGVEVDATTSCDSGAMPVIADKSINATVGETIQVNGVDATVVAEINDFSSMNRAGIIAEGAAYDECVKKEEPGVGSEFGLITEGLSAEDLKQVVTLTGDENLSVLAKPEFIENNRAFWKNNGTPIILQLMAYLAGYAAVANKKAKQASLLASERELASMEVVGVKEQALKKIETIKALKEGTKAAVVAAVAAPAFAAAINAAEFGLRVGVGLREVAVGFLFTTGAKIFGGRRAVTKFARTTNTSEVMR